MDYNPSDEFHWIYDHILTRPDCTLIKSTYLDNTFLDPVLRKEIELLKDTDENYWRVYGLGERGVSGSTIYTHWDLVDSLPEGGEHIFGLDYGFNHPTAIIEVVLKDDEIWWHERLHRRFMQNADRIKFMQDEGIVDQYIYGDSENPEAIKEMQGAGLNVIPAKKGPGSVKAGIDKLKQRKLHITKASVNLLKEIKAYKWKMKGDITLDEPVKLNDDGMDAGRMAVFSYLDQGFVGFV
jgi:phage terminase large subunit